MAFQSITGWFGKRKEQTQNMTTRSGLTLLPQDFVTIDEKTRQKDKLGEGWYSKVYIGKCADGKSRAVKVFKENVIVAAAKDEFDKLNSLKHPNIVSVYGMWEDPHKERNAPAIVMELCDSSLHTYIKERYAIGISTETNLQIQHNIASAMVYLHGNNVVHGDLRCTNVLVNERDGKLTVKLTDFGMARCLNPKTQSHITATIPDKVYLPPEVFKHDEHKDKKKNWAKLTREVDVFCFGPIVIELGCGEFPEPTSKYLTKGRDKETYTELERRDKYLKKVKLADRMYTQFIAEQCMRDRPEERVDFMELQLIIEGYQKKYENRPDKAWLEEKQLEIEEIKAQMAADRITLCGIPDLEEELERAKDENALLVDEVKVKAASIQGKEKELADLKNERDQTHNKLTDAQNDMMKWREAYDKLLHSKDALSKDSEELKNDIEALKGQLQMSQQHLAQAQSKGDESLSVAKENAQKVEDLMEKLQQMSEQLQKSRKDLVQAQSQRDESSSVAEEKTKELTTLKAELQQKSKQLRKSQKDLAQAQSQRDESLSVAEEKAKKFTALTAELQQKSKMVADLEEVNKEVNRDRTNIINGEKKLKQAHDEEVHELQSRNENIMRENAKSAERWAQEKATLDHELAILKEELNSRTAALKNSEEQQDVIHKQQMELKEVKAKLVSLTKETEDMGIELRVKKKKIFEHERNYQEVRQQVESTNREKNNLVTQLSKFKSDVAQEREAWQIERTSLQHQNRQDKDWKGRYAQLQKKFEEEKKHRNVELTKTKDELKLCQKKISTLTTQLEGSNNVKSKLEIEKQTLTWQVRRLEDEKKHANEQKTAAEAKVKNLQNELRATKLSLTAMDEDIKEKQDANSKLQGILKERNNEAVSAKKLQEISATEIKQLKQDLENKQKEKQEQLEAFEMERQEWTKKAEDLSKKCEHISDEKEMAMKEINAAWENHAKLEEQIQGAKVCIEKYLTECGQDFETKASLQMLVVELNRVQQVRVADLRKENHSLEVSLTAVTSSYDNERIKVESDKKTLRDANNSLSEQNQKLSEDLQKLQDTLKENEAQTEEAREAIKELDKYSKRVRQLKEELETKSMSVKKLEAESIVLKEHKEEIQVELQKTKQKLEETMKRQEEEGKEIVEREKDSMQEVETKDRAMEELKILLAQKDRELTEATSQQKRAVEDVQTLTKELRKTEKKLENSEESADCFAESEKKLKKDLEYVRKEKQETAARCQQLEREKNSLTVKLQSIQGSLEMSKTSLRKEQELASSHKKKIKELEEERKKLKKQWSDERKEFCRSRDDLRNKISAFQNNLSGIQSQKRSLLQVVAIWNEHVEEIGKMKSDILLRLEVQATTSEKLQRTNQALIASNRELAEIKDRLHKKLIAANSEKDQLNKQLATCQDAVSEVKSRMQVEVETCSQALQMSLVEERSKLKNANQCIMEMEKSLKAQNESKSRMLREINELDAKCRTMETKLVEAAASTEALRRDSDRLHGIEEANRKTIFNQTEDQKRQAVIISALEKEKLDYYENLEGALSELHYCQEELAKKSKHCEISRLSEEELNSKLCAQKEVIAYLTWQLVEKKDIIERLTHTAESGKFVHAVMMECLESEYKQAIEDLEFQLSSCKEEAQQVASYAKKVESELNKKMKELDRCYSQRTSLQNELEELKTAAKKLRHEHEDLYVELSSKKRELQDKCRELDHTNLNFERIKKERNEFEDTQLGLLQRKAESERSIQNLERSISERTECCDALKVSKVTLEKKYTRLSASYTKLETEAKVLEDELTRIKHEFGIVSADKDILQGKYDRLKQNLEEKTIACQKLKEENRNLTKWKKQAKQLKSKQELLENREADLRKASQEVEEMRVKLQARDEAFDEKKSLVVVQSIKRQQESMQRKQEEMAQSFTTACAHHKRNLSSIMEESKKIQNDQLQLVTEQKIQEMITTALSGHDQLHVSELQAEARLQKSTVEIGCTLDQSQPPTKNDKVTLQHQREDSMEFLTVTKQKCDREMQMVEDNSLRTCYSLKTVRSFLIPFLLSLPFCSRLTHPKNKGFCVPKKELAQLCAISHFKLVSSGSLSPKHAHYHSPIYSECPKAVNDVIERVRECYEHELYHVCSIDFLKCKDKHYLCKLLFTVIPRMMTQDCQNFEPDILYTLIRVPLQPDSVDSVLSSGIDHVYQPTWYSQLRHPPTWCLDFKYDELPEKVRPVVDQLELETARFLKENLDTALAPFSC